jgi:hypothetical protein
MSADKDLRGPISFSLGNPMRVRRVNGQLIEEPVLRKQARGDPYAEYLEGVREAEYDPRMGNGRASGFSRYAASQPQQRFAGTGAGPDVTPDQEHFDDYSIGTSGGGGQSVSQTHYNDGDLDADLFGQPARKPRDEYYDDAGDAADSHFREPGYLADNDLEYDLLDKRPETVRKPSNSTFAKRKF